MPAGDPPLTLRDLKDIDLARLKGVGPALEGRLADMGLHNVLDLLQHYPRRWVDRTKRVDIAELEIGESATVIGEVRTVHARTTRNRKSLVEVVIHDGSSVLSVTFFNQAWRAKQLAEGTEVSLYGKLDVYRGKRQMTMPVVDVLGRAGVADDKTGVVLPIYPQSGKAEVFTWQLRTLVGEALAKCMPRGFADPVDEPILDAQDLVDAHARHARDPSPRVDGRDACRRAPPQVRRVPAHADRPRRPQARTRRAGVGHPPRRGRPARRSVPRPAPVRAHRRPGAGDRRRSRTTWPADGPMHRLLQGDVGSGKTVVALAALLVAVQGGYQGAFMAPTEVLAEQHYLGSVKMLEGLTVGAEGSLLGDRPGARRAAHQPHDRGRTPPHREGPREQRGRHPRRHARAALRRRRVHAVSGSR